VLDLGDGWAEVFSPSRRAGAEWQDVPPTIG
jgi:hypothetical protein